MARRRTAGRLCKRSDFFLGSLCLHCGCHKTDSVVTPSVSCHACLRLLLQHGFPELLPFDWHLVFCLGRLLETRGRELDYGATAFSADCSCPSDRLRVVRRNNCVCFSVANSAELPPLALARSRPGGLCLLAGISRRQLSLRSRLATGSLLLDERFRSARALRPSIHDSCESCAGLG